MQLAYPVYWWLCRGLHWSPFWRTWWMIHLVQVLLLLLATGIGFLAKPDLGRHWG